MTTSQLKDKISTSPKGHGHYKVTIEFRGNYYHCVTHNMLAIDRIGNESLTPKENYASEKQALLALWDECKIANDL